MNPDLLYIAGGGHSGTTLLNLILGSHPHTFGVGEINNLDDWILSRKLCTCGTMILECPAWAPVFAKFAEGTCAIPEIPIKLATDATQPRTPFPGDTWHAPRYVMTRLGFCLLPVPAASRLAGLFGGPLWARTQNAHSLYAILRNVSKKRVVVESSKSVPRFRLLHAQRPDATRAILMTRDGRGNMLSIRKRRNWSAASFAWRWRITSLYTLRLLEALPDQTYLHVRYEELVRQPESTINRICAFAGLDFEPAMLAYRQVEHHHIGGNPIRVGTDETIVEDLRWRSQLSPADIATFERIAGSLNRRLLGPYYHP